MDRIRPLLGAALVLAAAAAPLQAAPEPPAAVKHAATLFAKDAAGVVAYLAVADSRLEAPMFNRRFGSRLWIVNVDATPTRALVLAFTEDGKPAPETSRARHERDTNAAYKSRERGFDAPYDARHMGRYAITPAPCAGCAAGETAYAFTTTHKDPELGNGTFVLDAAHHVVRVSYAPAVMPKGASTADLTLERGPAPGVGWSLRHVRGRFTGGIGPVQGSYALEQTMSGHRRFATVEQALAAAPK